MNAKHKMINVTAGLAMLVSAACGTPSPRPDVRQEFTETERGYALQVLEAKGVSWETRDVNQDGIPDTTYTIVTASGEQFKYWTPGSTTIECKRLGWSDANCVERGGGLYVTRDLHDPIYKRMQ